jgi:hypothetical protein
MADGTTYPQSLQQILGQPSQPGVFGYGFSQNDIQRLQQAGITQEQLMQMGLSTQPQTTTSAYQSGGGGGPTTSPSAGGIQQSNNAALLQAMLKLGGPQQQQQQAPPPGNAYGQAYPLYAQDAQGNPTGQPVYANPTNQASLLGAAALEMPAVINPPPSAALDPRSGVSKVGGALIGSTVPSTGGWTWNSVAQNFGLSASGIADFQAQGLTPQQVADKFNATWNPVTERASLAAGYGPQDIAAFKAQGVTPQQAAAKFGYATGLPTPSATPGMLGPWTTQPGIFKQAATVAPTLAAGATPLTAAVQPTAIAYNPTATPFAQAPPAPGVTPPAISPTLFAAHTSALADAGKALFAHFGGDPNSASPADIANFHTQLTGALAAAPQPTAAKKMQSGGLVSDPDPDPNAPPEARRKTLSTPAQTSSAPTTPTVPTGSHLATGLTSAAHTYANSIDNFTGVGTRDIRNTPLDPDPDLPYLKAAGMGGAGMAGGAGSGRPTANALSGIGSGLAQVAEGIKASAPPWQMQQSAIPAPPPAPAAPQLTPPPAPQQAQQGINPYAAYAANQAMYPTSPYYR